MTEQFRQQREEQDELIRLSQCCCCAECGGPLVTPWDAENSCMLLVCGQDRSHQGYAKLKSYGQLFEEGHRFPVFIENRLQDRRKKKMTEELGLEATTALEPYRGITSLTRKQATTVLATIWPDAPPPEVAKAAMLCSQYGLNPLMRHVFLIPFNKGRENEEWAIVMGIKATRLLASRRGGYSYVDGPRIMTEEEVKSIMGEAQQDKLCSITRVRNIDGMEAVGYGYWPKSKQVQGAEKGNSAANMAHIRSERAALDRLFPGEMPPDTEVMDEKYIEGDYKVLDVTKMVEEGEFKDVEYGERVGEYSRFDDLLVACPIHGQPWRRDNFGKLSHSHEGGWCKAQPIFWEIFAKEAKRVGFVSEPDEKWKLDEWLKERFGGNTWSKMSPDQWLTAIKLMERENPPAEAPQEEGAPEELPL